MSVDLKYKDGYSAVLQALEQKALEPGFEVKEVENELKTLYSYEGLGWAGRGMVKEAEISSAIAAYEAFLSKRRI